MCRSRGKKKNPKTQNMICLDIPSQNSVGGSWGIGMGMHQQNAAPSDYIVFRHLYLAGVFLQYMMEIILPRICQS